MGHFDSRPPPNLVVVPRAEGLGQIRLISVLTLSPHRPYDASESQRKVSFFSDPQNQIQLRGHVTWAVARDPAV